MTYIEQAIRKAIEGGWRFAYDQFDSIENIDEEPRLAFLDPSFWQSLGKAMGWQQGETGILDEGVVLPILEVWKGKWIDFVLHLAAGKDAESYFKEILTLP